MKKAYKKQVKFAFFVVLLLFIVSIVTSVFFSQNQKQKSNENILITKFETSDIVQITNALPLSDELGKGYTGDGLDIGIEGYVSFSITNTNNYSVNYEIYLTKQNLDEKEIKENYVTFYLTDENDTPYNGFEKNKLPSYKDLTYLSDKPASKLLYSGSIDGNTINQFVLRVWLSDSYAISPTLESFQVDVDVREK